MELQVPFLAPYDLGPPPVTLRLFLPLCQTYVRKRALSFTSCKMRARTSFESQFLHLQNEDNDGVVRVLNERKDRRCSRGTSSLILFGAPTPQLLTALGGVAEVPGSADLAGAADTWGSDFLGVPGVRSAQGAPPSLESGGQEEKPERCKGNAGRHLWPFSGSLSRPSVYPSAAAADTRC